MQNTFILGLAIAMLANTSDHAVAASTDELTIERIYSDPPLHGRPPISAEISPKGNWVSYLRASDADSEVSELWGQPLPHGTPRRLVAMSDLIGQAKAKLTEAEKMVMERRRIMRSGITSYQWCGDDEQRLLVPMSGDLYAVELRGDQPPSARILTESGTDPAREPQCDKAGRQVAFVRHGDLWVQSLLTGTTQRLTTTGSATHSTGLAEFIAEEELDRQKGFWWSPHGNALLALEVDESAVPVKVRTQIFSDRTEMTEQRYPSAGEANAKVSALVIEIGSTKIAPLPLPKEEEYIARAGWFADGTPWLQWLTRDQTRLDLVEFEVDTGRARTLLSEHDPAWVDLHDDLQELPAHALSGKPALLWSSERF
jgi:dipeptidyl-peptidase-4